MMETSLEERLRKDAALAADNAYRQARDAADEGDEVTQNSPFEVIRKSFTFDTPDLTPKNFDVFYGDAEFGWAIEGDQTAFFTPGLIFSVTTNGDYTVVSSSFAEGVTLVLTTVLPENQGPGPIITLDVPGIEIYTPKTRDIILPTSLCSCEIAWNGVSPTLYLFQTSDEHDFNNYVASVDLGSAGAVEGVSNNRVSVPTFMENQALYPGANFGLMFLDNSPLFMYVSKSGGTVADPVSTEGEAELILHIIKASS